MPIEWNKVTWYSKLIAVILFVIVFYVGFNLGEKKKEIYTADPVSEKVIKELAPISITTENIKEENFTGKIPKISGESIVAVKARAYVAQTVALFKKQADVDVPLMRTDFGEESPTAQYEIDIDAKHIKSIKTESIILLVYTYTGGAHGNSLYKVFTSSIATNKILSLADVIKKDKQTNFTELVKKKLNAWRPDGSDGVAVFSEEVNALKFSSFENWSFNDSKLLLYFAQYEIGPGVLGEIVFPLFPAEIEDFLEPDYSS